MRRKGVLYDVGRVTVANWRPDYSPAVVHRELEIVKAGLHCNAVKICARDIGRLAAAAAEGLRARWPGRLVFSVGTELTFFMRDIIDGRTFNRRVRGASLELLRSGSHDKPLNAFLARASRLGVQRPGHLRLAAPA
jgi:hypothetical protein